MHKSKIASVIALLVIASMSLTACGGAATTAPATAAPTTAPQPTVAPTAAPAEKVTLTIMHNWGPDDTKGPALQSIFKDFMAANPDIVIKDTVAVDADIPLKVETAAAAKQEPDLVFVQRVGPPLDWTDSGVTIPVNDLIAEWGLADKFVGGALASYTQVDGKIQAFPLEGFTWPIWYNSKVLKDAGVEIPKTTDELINMAAKVRAIGDEPVIASGGDGMGLYLFYLVLQSAMTDDESAKALRDGDWTGANAIKGVQLFTALRDAGVFVDGVEGVDYDSGNARFFGGDVAMSHFGAWSYADPAAKAVVPNVQLGGFPLPAGSPRKAPVYYAGFSAKGIWITPNGAAKMDAVKKFVQFIYQPEMIARFVEQGGMTAPIKDVPVDTSKLDPLFAQSLVLPGEVPLNPDLLVPAKIQPVIVNVSQEAFGPGVTADKILADLTDLYAANK